MYNKMNGYYNERGFWIPFAIGGLAGGALGYGLANNNKINYYHPPYQYRPPMMYPVYPPYYFN
jgi:hypothetical protein